MVGLQENEWSELRQTGGPGDPTFFGTAVWSLELCCMG